jgi:regulator of sirC expression with transglutaminase-like and TPR domain
MEVLRTRKQPDVDLKLKQDRAIRVYRNHAARAIAEERWEVAEIFLDRILEVNPRHTEAWLMKGHLRQHCRDDAEEALLCYRKVITLCGHDSRHPHVRRAKRSMGRLLSAWGA